MYSILITGGAGFVGSSIAKLWKEQFSKDRVVVIDNLKRRGSEFNLRDFKKLGIDFQHGDIRIPYDLLQSGLNFDLLIEASAEPSVLAGLDDQGPNYLIDTNLNGTLNCLEFGRKKTGGMIFLSTSRVYSIPALRELELELEEDQNRFHLKKDGIGYSSNGISESFPVIGKGFRSLYGSTKFASELFLEEYFYNFKFPVFINRCGVIAGPGQFGKTDQGVFTLWVANHYFKKSLSYTGFGGQGKQVRDLLHPKDLFFLILKQFENLNRAIPQPFNVGGGILGSVSLREYTTLCEKVTENSVIIEPKLETNPVDIPYYITDHTKATQEWDWEPTTKPLQIVQEIYAWIQKNEEFLKDIFT